MLKSEVVTMFNSMIERLDKRDKPSLCMTWNNLIDTLEREGSITRAKSDGWVKPFICGYHVLNGKKVRN